MSKINWERLARSRVHPLQITILETCLASRKPLSPSDLAEQLGKPLGNVSYHVRVLHDAGLLKLVRTTPVRGAVQHHYQPTPLLRAKGAS